MSELFSKSKDNQIQQNGLIMSIDEVIDYLNTSNKAISSLQYENAKLRTEVNQQKSFISYLLVENEEYEEESEDMQTKINVLYHEAKKHMSSTEWKKFNRGIIESEEELGIKWVRL